MREPRNPFRMRTSEHIESDATFLQLFSPAVLDVLPKHNLLDRVHIFRSAPGGGKTSLFRVFTPGPLLALHRSRTHDNYKDLYQSLRDLEVLSDQSGPQLLGIMLSCRPNYSSLEDLSFDASRKERLLFALLNARLILAALRGALTLKGHQYPDDLNLLQISRPANIDLPDSLPIPGSGRGLYEWACAIEKGVCDAIDSFGPTSYDFLECHDTLYALSLVRPECIIYKDVPVANRTLILLDDVHKLTTQQRQKLFATLFDLRSAVGVWIAERLEALSSDELLAVGATTGREYGEPISLEDFWRSKTSTKRFEGVVTNIADRRASSVHDIEVGSFPTRLQDSLDGVDWQERFQQAIDTISLRVSNREGAPTRYKDWIVVTEMSEGTARERAVAWKTLEILIERDSRNAQLAFDFFALSPDSLEKKEDASAVRNAAEFLVFQEFGIPYYFGISRLATLSSSNIEQFLAFAGGLFEVMISAALLKKWDTGLTPERQETILKKATQLRWQEIPRRIANGRDVLKFLEAVRQCAKWETSRPSAPYAPGVTGIALSMAERDWLVDPNGRRQHPEYDRLIRILSACISHNLLEPFLDRPQGQKGKTWMILYLNRWLCLHFGLPLQYGGWRPKRLNELAKWPDQGFHVPDRGGGTLL